MPFDKDRLALAFFQRREWWAFRRLAMSHTCPVSAPWHRDVMSGAELTESTIRQKAAFSEFLNGFGPDLFVELIAFNGDGVVGHL